MKKVYEMPVAEKVKFNYTEQVVASCDEVWTKARRDDGAKCSTTHVSYND